jgi:hypothetical protein
MLFPFNFLQSQFDESYQAVLNYATTLGYTLPSSGQRVKQNKLVVDLKAAGIWNKLDTFGNLATDGSSNFALIDWKRLALYTAVNSPTFTTNGGFQGNGTSSYIDTNFNPSIGTNNYTLNDASRIFWTDNRGTNTSFEGNSGNIINQSRNNTLGGISFNSGTTTTTGITNYNVDGWHSVNRISSTNVNVYLGSNFTPQVGLNTSTSLFNSNQYIFRGGSNYGNHRIRIYAMGSNLSSQNTAFYNAINTYLTSL